ncbi:MAG TPA: hypothetical protein VLD37_07355 [Candidatus Bilamarchaeum sp.]|nr:hypothetical protein [Candidatus Bilamarchaeum sp.]
MAISERSGQSPRREGKARDFRQDPKLEMSPTWVRAGASDEVERQLGKAAIAELYVKIARELRRAGYDTTSDLQTEPLEGYSVLSCFSVNMHPKGSREPEQVGMVSLYSIGGAPGLLKLNPHAGGGWDALHQALTEAVGSLIESLPHPPGSGSIDIRISEGNSPPVK